MADSFFGFDTNSPSLGEGYREDEGSGINLLNDETFGDGAVVGGDWEDFHDQMTEGDELAGGARLKQNDLEDSLNQLVVDDDEEDSGFGKGIPMNQRRPADLDHLFGPASPPGLLHTEQLLSGQMNIWGSPVTRESDVHRQQEDGLKSLLKQLQAPPQARNTYLQDPSIMQLSNSLPNAKTLGEIECGIIGMPHEGGGGGDARPRAFTVEELEKQLQMSHPSGALQSQQIAPIGTPPTSTSYLQQNFSNLSGGIPPPQQRENPNIVLADMTQPPPGFSASVIQQQPAPQQRRVSPTNTASASDTQSTTKDRTSPPSTNAPFLANTPVQQRIPVTSAHTDPTHQRGRMQTGPAPQGTSSVRQNLFNNSSRGQTSQSNGVSGPQRPFNNYHDNRDHRGGNGHHENHGDFRDHRGNNYHDGHGDYRDNRDYHDNRGDYRDNREYHDNNHWLDKREFRDNRDYNHRGYHENRADYHRDYDRDFNNRGDYHNREYNRDYQRDYRKRGPGQHNYHRQRYDSQGYDDEDMFEDASGRDEYAGLMSKKEKDWIIKIQLMQLQTDNPYLDDFYYTTWQLKKMHTELEKKREAGKLTKNDKGEPKLVLPHLDNKGENKNYKPVQFENSLGRLTAASVHNPRQALQLAKSNSLDKDEKNKEVKKFFKALLIDVEKCYDDLLEIDDIEKRVLALPEEARMPLFQERHHIINQLYSHLQCENNNQSHFLKFLNLRKGVAFIARLLPLLSKDDAASVIRALLRNMSTISKKEWQEEMLPRLYTAMSNVIDEVDLEGLVGLALALSCSNTDPSINHSLQNNFGVSVICCLVNRGEAIYTTCNPLDLDVQHQNAWRQFILKLADAVRGTAQTQLVHPTTCAASTLPLHMRRLVDKQTYFSIQDKLHQLTTTA